VPDLTTYTWRELAPATHPNAAQEFGFCWAGTKAVLFGGVGSGALLNETWVLEGEEWRQLSPATPPSARILTSLAWDGTRVLLFGGLTSGLAVSNETWSLDIGTEEWTQLAPTHTPNVNTLYGAGAYTLVWDGSRFLLQIQRLTGSSLSAETWQFTGGDWTNVSPANQPDQTTLNGRAWTAITYDSGGVTLFGGKQAGAQQPIFDPTDGATWQFTSNWALDVLGSDPNTHPDSSLTGHPDATRDSTPIASDGTEILLFGGHVYDQGFIGRLQEDDTWMLDVTGWTELPQSTHPQGRYNHGLVWDDVLDRFVLYGGYREDGGAQTRFTDTWVFEDITPPPPTTISASISHVFGAN
jgi:hypothetical protein